MKTDLTKLLAEHGMNRAKLARLMNVNKSSVSRWAAGTIPAERAVDIERVTGIPRNRLRPDLFLEA